MRSEIPICFLAMIKWSGFETGVRGVTLVEFSAPPSVVTVTWCALCKSPVQSQRFKLNTFMHLFYSGCHQGGNYITFYLVEFNYSCEFEEFGFLWEKIEEE